MIKLLSKLIHLILGDAGMKFINFVVLIYLAKVGHAESLGWIVAGGSFLKWTQLGSNLGWNTLGIMNGNQSADQNSDRDHVDTQIFWSKMIWSIPVFIFMSFLAYISNDQEIVRSICLLYILNSIFEILSPLWYFQGQQNFKIVSLFRLTAHLTYGCLVVLQIKSPENFIQIPLLYLYSQILPFALLYFLAIKGRFPAFRISEIKQLFKIDFQSHFHLQLSKSLHIGAAQIFLGSTLALPPLLLGVFSAQNVGATFEYTGQFGLALRVLVAMMVIDQLIHLILLSGLQPKTNELQSYFKLAIVVSGLGSLLPWLVQFIPWIPLLNLLGKDFSQVEIILKTLSWVLGLTIFHSFIQAWMFHIFSSKKVMQLSIYASIAPIIYITWTALSSPQDLPQAVLIGESLLLSFLAYHIFKKEWLYYVSWFALLGFGPWYFLREVSKKFSFHSHLHEVIMTLIFMILWASICYFHPKMTPKSEIRNLFKRWQKLNK